MDELLEKVPKWGGRSFSIKKKYFADFGHLGLKFKCDQYDQIVSWKGDLSKHKNKMHPRFIDE